MKILNRCPDYVWCEGPKVITTREHGMYTTITLARAAHVEGRPCTPEEHLYMKESIISIHRTAFGHDPAYLLLREGWSMGVATDAVPFDYYPHSDRKVALT